MTGENAAPAEMPGVEERLRRILAEARIEPEPEASDFAVENIKALFAQKAVKPPTHEDDAASSEIAVQSQLAAEAALAGTNLRQSERIRQLEAALAAERERCAKIAESAKSYDDNLQRSAGCATTGQRIAAAIRAEGE